MRAATRPRNRPARALATALGALALVVCGAAAARGNHDGGHDGGGHGGGGHASGGAAHAAAGHAGHAAAPARGGAYGHGAVAHYYRGGHGAAAGYRPRVSAVAPGPGGYARGPGGVRGWHGGGGWWNGRWWGGYGIGLYFAALPWYYETFWWGGVPYYYADYNFYRWNDAVAQYEVVAPPAEDAEGAGPSAGAGAGAEIYVYPRQNQSQEQQQRDRYDCHRWAADQTGFDPTRANGGVSAEQTPARAGAYRRAESACLEGRGYTVR
jgi:hypothetical protein